MHLAKVVGRVVATVKQDTLASVTLQWIQPVTARGVATGRPLVAVDCIGSGPGELVFYVTSREATLTLRNSFAAADAGIVGKVDWTNIGGVRVLPDAAGPDSL